jgi:ribosomal protein L31E
MIGRAQACILDSAINKTIYAKGQKVPRRLIVFVSYSFGTE